LLNCYRVDEHQLVLIHTVENSLSLVSPADLLMDICGLWRSHVQTADLTKHHLCRFTNKGVGPSRNFVADS